MNEDNIELRRLLLQRLRRGPESADARPKDSGDMLEALKRAHPEIWELISKK